MAHSLVSWAQRLPDLTPTERNVFTAICDVVDPMQGGYFYKRLSHFILEDAPFIRTESRLRAHIARIQAKGYMKTEHRGGGPKARNTRLSRTHYRILYPGHIAPPPAEQFRLPLLTLITNADAMIRVRSHTSKSNASKFIPSESESKLARIPSESESKLARIPSESESKLARIPSESESKLARIPSESEGVSLYNRIHVTEGASGAATEGDAAENLLASSSWFDELATACAERGVRGVRPALFDGLRPKLAACPVRLTQEQAAWCAEEIMYANRRGNIRNPTGLLIHIVKRVLGTGETGIYIEDTDVINW